MAYPIEIRERQRDTLSSLLELKKDNEGINIVGLDGKIRRAVAVMDGEDVAWVERVIGVKAID